MAKDNLREIKIFHLTYRENRERMYEDREENTEKGGNAKMFDSKQDFLPSPHHLPSLDRVLLVVARITSRLKG